MRLMIPTTHGIKTVIRIKDDIPHRTDSSPGSNLGILTTYVKNTEDIRFSKEMRSIVSTALVMTMSHLTITEDISTAHTHKINSP